MGECDFRRHVWEGSIVQEPPSYRSTALRCGLCHVGYLLEITGAPRETVQVSYWVFPADGGLDVSRDVKTWAILACESTIKDMHEDGIYGIHIVRGTPIIGGPRPKALDKHRRFKRIQGQSL